MNSDLRSSYDHIRSGGSGYYEQKRGIISVHGKEALRFLDGLMSNDLKTLEDNAHMAAAFPNAQGRLVAVARIFRQGEKYLIDTEDATRERLFKDLFRFTYAGDFFVEDLSSAYRSFSVFGSSFLPSTEPVVEFERRGGGDFIVGVDDAADFLTELQNIGAIEVSDELYEILRIESGIPKYGKDMDESTIVPELAIDGLISYNKGCYIGQEIIARIHFRGHVAKQMSGLVFIGDDQPAFGPVGELKTTDGKNAGRITSHTFSPKLGKNIALAYVRYENLAPGTILLFDGHEVKVCPLPFI